MEPLAETLPALGLAVLAPALWQLRQGVRGTALAGAWFWIALSWVAVLVVRVVTLWGSLTGGPAALAWYLAAVLALAPGIAVLGARWPTARVWNAFVVCPLIAVFLWPVAVAVLRGSRLEHWVLEAPMVVGYLLVLVMGAGNYVGGRWTLAALLWGAAWVLIVPALCPPLQGLLPRPELGRSLGCLLISLAGWSISRSVHRTPPLPGGLDRVWNEFRDLFGVVWSRRIQDRFNEQAPRSRLAVRLGWNGVEDPEGHPLRESSLTPQDLTAAEPQVRWLLQKFVEPAWIDQRLMPDSGVTPRASES